MVQDADVWHLINSYFAKYGLVRHQIESFDNFMTTFLPIIVQEASEIVITGSDVRHVITLCNVSVQKPTVEESDGYERPILPHLARLRNQTYANPVMVDLVHDIKKDDGTVDRNVYRELLLCRIPTMVGSSFCHTHKMDSSMLECGLDQGGYFVINGIEKALIAQEKLHTNHAYIFNVKQPSKYSLVCEIRACNELKMRSTSTLYMYVTHSKKGATPEIIVQLPFIDIGISVLALFKLLGVSTRDEALIFIVGHLDAEESRLLRGIMDNDTIADMSDEEVWDWLGKEGTKEVTRERRIRYLQHICANELLPMMGLVLTEEVNRKKACYIGFMVKKLLAAYTGKVQCDDRDHFANKRIDSAGVLCSLLFRQVYRNYMKILSAQLARMFENNKLENVNMAEVMNSKKITNAFRYAFGTGNWGTQRGNAQTGVAQVMGRMTVAAAVSNLRRINTPINRESKAPKPRQLHFTSWGIVCPVETPEGISCGLVSNLAMMAHVRVGTFSGSIREQLKQVSQYELIPLLNCSDQVRAEGVPILVNGVLFMYTRNGSYVKELLAHLRIMRRKSFLPFDCSISCIDSTVMIDSDPGCLMRPLFVADKLEELPNLIRQTISFEHLWEQALGQGIIEYIDKQEETDLVVGLFVNQPDEKYTHYELHPSLINGLCASLIVFPDHNQAPRNSYQSAMGKQAVGVFALNYRQRMDAIAHVLCTPQRPLVSTHIDQMTRMSEAPTGLNAIVVIACYTSFNQEDSLIVNQAALDRGLFRSIKYQTYKDEERINGADVEKFENPTEFNVSGMRVGVYDKLQSNGLLPVGTKVKSGDAIIGKTITTSAIGEGARRVMKRDRSLIIKHADEAVVDAILQSKNKDGTMLTKVRTRKTRTPVVGDKLCFTEDHDILTMRGWVSCSDITLEDHVMAYDPHTKSMQYEQVQEVHHYEASTNWMYEIISGDVTLCTTLNHNLYIKMPDDDGFALVPAHEAYKAASIDFLKTCKTYIRQDRQSLSAQILPYGREFEENNNYWLIFFGAWMRTGRVLVDDEIRMTLVSADVDASLLDMLGFTSMIYEYDDTLWHAILDTYLFDYLQGLGTENKRFPEWCFLLSMEETQQLMIGFLIDVEHFKINNVRFYVSIMLADDVQRLALHAGYTADIQSSRRNQSLRCVRLVKENNSVRVRHKYERIFEDHCKVHCVSVRTQILYVRRQGQGVWCGNSSRHGQKGVIGLVLPATDMPFTRDGVQPDIIVNPHAIPSRMTVGHLLECLMGKLCCAEGCIGNATPFCGVSIQQIGQQLESNGYDAMGEEILYNGMTGEKLEGKVFIGPTYYQRLKHMVDDKHHSRSRGPVQLLTRQPTEGRARDGGLRFGEMERDTLLAHGAANVLTERLFEQSDPFVATVCGTCGLLAQPAAENTLLRNRAAYCRNCKSSDNVHDVRMPFAFKLLLQELMAMHIAPRLSLLTGPENTEEIETVAVCEPFNFC